MEFEVKVMQLKSFWRKQRAMRYFDTLCKGNGTQAEAPLPSKSDPQHIFELEEQLRASKRENLASQAEILRLKKILENKTKLSATRLVKFKKKTAQVAKKTAKGVKKTAHVAKKTALVGKTKEQLAAAQAREARTKKELDQLRILCKSEKAGPRSSLVGLMMLP